MSDSKGLNKNKYIFCFCFRRIFKDRLLEPPQDVKDLFEQYSQNGIMSPVDLLKFLVEKQGEEDAKAGDAQAIFNSLKHLNIFQRKGLDLEAFFRYLIGDLNVALSPTPKLHDMTAPLSHYFIYTSHNTYLTGNQLSSDSSDEPIKAALRQGVRVIELDLWPSSKNDNVEVRHGGTLTAPVDLIKCLHIIKNNAFIASEYPVVITFEDHLTAHLQAKVANMVTETFGEMLFCPKSDQMDKFPSPETLKKKILISTKPPKEYLESHKSREKATRQKSRKSPKKEQSEDEKDQLGEQDHLPDEDEENTASEYRNVIAIHAGKPKGPSENWLSIDPNRVRRLSLSEQELENAARTQGEEIIRFTQQNFLRVYPRGIRLDSSNYNPFVGWMHGAQMVAFNMQGYGKNLWVMKGMFKANGGRGYVKKPKFLLEPDCHPVQKTLKIKVYMGEGWDLDFRRTHFDLYSPPDFFVKISVVGAKTDKANGQTKVVEDDWLPVWNEEFEFQLNVYELAILRIEVHEYDTSGKHDFGGQTCLPVSELRTGIRAVPLHNRKGEQFKHVRLLMEFEIV
eukprot:XP_025014304.1 phosphoinositide phospholipase C 2-like isoform X2 [Ricinus communis]